MATWHVWQAKLPSGQLAQFSAVEDGPTRPSGAAWTDPVVSAAYDGLVCPHVGTVQCDPVPDGASHDALVDLLTPFFPADVTGIDGAGVTLTFTLPEGA